MKRILLIALTVNLSACASYFKRKECESINWFEHGKKVALRGDWLNADQTVNECRKAEADIQESQLDLGFKNGMQKYCSGPHAYLVGKNGDFYSRDLCEGPQISVLMTEHKKGVADYCAKSNGFNAGTSGKKYLNICPKELESTFLPEYRKGRKKYIQAMIETTQADIHQLDSRLSSLNSELGFSNIRLTQLQSEQSLVETQKNLTPVQSSQRNYLENRLTSLNSDISTQRVKISTSESERNQIEKKRTEKMNELAELKSELPSLD